MFTGLITHIGAVASVQPTAKGMRLRIATAMADATLTLGESIAVSGCCLTVVSQGDGWFETELSHETLARTALDQAAVGEKVNLERALRLSDRLGGHIVQGHVDGVGTVQDVRSVGEAFEVDVEVPPDLRKYIVEKGSLCIAGVSLTVNRVHGNVAGVTLIPHTWNHTTLCGLMSGSRVNLEVDVLAKYVESLMAAAR
jgi:riboflavin synthase